MNSPGVAAAITLLSAAVGFGVGHATANSSPRVERVEVAGPERVVTREVAAPACQEALTQASRLIVVYDGQVTALKETLTALADFMGGSATGADALAKISGTRTATAGIKADFDATYAKWDAARDLCRRAAP